MVTGRLLETPLQTVFHAEEPACTWVCTGCRCVIQGQPVTDTPVPLKRCLSSSV